MKLAEEDIKIGTLVNLNKREIKLPGVIKLLQDILTLFKPPSFVWFFPVSFLSE